jgi:hypothetical protein
MNLTLQGLFLFTFVLCPFFPALLSCIKLLTSAKLTFHIDIMILMQETCQRKFVPSRGWQWHSEHNQVQGGIH